MTTENLFGNFIKELGVEGPKQVDLESLNEILKDPISKFI